MSNNVVLNSFLLLLALVFMLIPVMVDSKENLCFYISLGFSVALLLNTVVALSFKISYYIIIMSILFFAHWLFTPDKLMTVILFFVTMLLFEIVKQYEFSYKYIVYPFLAFSAIGLILTLPDLLSSITEVHLSRSTLYEGLYTNPNTTSEMYLIVIMCTLLFIKTPYLRKVFVFSSIVCIFATGCRNGLLCLALFLFLRWMLEKTSPKRVFILFLIILLSVFIYMVFIESQHIIDINYMGKEAGSSGRSAQIIYVINHFSLNLFGHGRDVILNAIVSKEHYAVHNFYVHSIYSSGALIVLGYFYYIYDVYKKLSSIVAKAFMLTFHFSFFFEPGLCYYYSISVVLVNVILSLKFIEERNSEGEVEYNCLIS